MLAKAVKQPLPGLRDDLDLTVTAHTLLKWTVKWEPVCRHKAYGTSFSVRSISDWIKQQPPYTLPSRLQLWNGASLKKFKCKHFSSSLFSLHKCILWLMNNFWSAAKHKSNSMYFVWCQENKSGTECFSVLPSLVFTIPPVLRRLSVKYIALSTWICIRPDSFGWKMAFIWDLS